VAFDRAAGGPPTVGYVARICPEKGLDRLVDAMLLLWQMPGMADVRLRVGGYVGKKDAAFYEQQQARVRAAGKAGQVDFHGELTRDEKLALLDGSDVLSVPTAYVESKGIPVLEAWSRGVPVVQPAHGSFPELIERSGGAGVLVPPAMRRRWRSRCATCSPTANGASGSAGSGATRWRRTSPTRAWRRTCWRCTRASCRATPSPCWCSRSCVAAS
jgi:glycosyltransferase involved in cell wall biosynthesis